MAGTDDDLEDPVDMDEIVPNQKRHVKSMIVHGFNNLNWKQMENHSKFCFLTPGVTSVEMKVVGNQKLSSRHPHGLATARWLEFVQTVMDSKNQKKILQVGRWLVKIR